MDMIFFAYFYLALLVFTGLFIFTAIIIEKYVPADSKIMKWWRKHVIAPAPNDIDI